MVPCARRGIIGHLMNATPDADSIGAPVTSKRSLALQVLGCVVVAILLTVAAFVIARYVF
jgi:hypothetical protein